MRKIIITLLAILMFAAPALAETKIAYVDLQKALNLSKAGAEAMSNISAQAKKYEDEFKSMQDALKQKKDELEKQTALLSDTARAEKEREYQKGVKDLQRFKKDVNDELQQKDGVHTKRILKELIDILQKIGKDQNYTMIVEKTKGAVIFADENIDLTDELIKAYDASK